MRKSPLSTAAVSYTHLDVYKRQEVDESWYEDFYHHLRMEMDEYRRLKRSLRVLKSYTDYELSLIHI